MVIPSFLLVHEIVVEPYTGQGGNGPTYGPAVTVPCFVDDTRKRVSDDKGDQVVSESTCICELSTVAPPKSRVTVNGRVAYVITAKRRDGGGLPTPDHLEVALT